MGLNLSPDLQPAAGLVARRLATDVLAEVLHRKRPLDDVLEALSRRRDWLALEPRDRGFVRVLAMTALRQHGGLTALLSPLLRTPLPNDGARIELILKLGAAQLLLLDTPAHAAIDLAVEQARAEPQGGRFTGLVNAVLRRIARDGAAQWTVIDHARANTPDWLWAGWVAAYGEVTARKIATAHLAEPGLDLTVKQAGAAPALAAQLGGALLATGTVRLPSSGAVAALPGFDAGDWWVQDAAAALPARLLGDVRGKSVADLCAAPGGKTAQLAAASALVTAVDSSRPRLARLAANLERLHLQAELVHADLDNWRPERVFDAILLDAPCSATGTLRRHPDIALHRTPEEVVRQAARQARLLRRAVPLLAPGGMLVFCTCSLEAAEGPDLIAPFLAEHPAMRLDPIAAVAEGIDAVWVTTDGALRTLPCHNLGSSEVAAGMDGFFAARFRRMGLGT